MKRSFDAQKLPFVDADVRISEVASVATFLKVKSKHELFVKQVWPSWHFACIRSGTHYI